MTHSRTTITGLLDRHGLGPSRALGQNFVVDPNTVRRIAGLSGVGPGDPVVEIGGGLGSLTLALVETGARVTTIEMDRHLVPVLHEVLAGTDVRIVEGDAMALDWGDLLADAPVWTLVANLPYNVSTPLVLDLLVDAPKIERMLVMVQKEAGERLAARPGTAAWGIPSVKLSLRARARIVGIVGPNVFHPRPRVDSALVEIVRLDEPAVPGDLGVLVGLVERAFGQRRKMLRRSLAGLVADEQFRSADVAPEERPENLTIAEWGRLAAAVGSNPGGPAG